MHLYASLAIMLDTALALGIDANADAHVRAQAHAQPMSRAEYDQLVAQGQLDNARVELLRGAIIPMSPQGPLHSTVVRNLNRLLWRAIGDRAEIQIQAPIAASDDSEPEPDAAIIPTADYRHGHPEYAHLIVEVSESSVVRDLGDKAALYAECGVPEYWVVDVNTRLIEVHTDPDRGTYRNRSTRTDSDRITLVAFPDIEIPVAAIW